MELARAYGLDAVVLEAPYGQIVPAARVAEVLAKDASIGGVFVQATESSTGAAHDVRGIAQAVRPSGAILVVDGITGLGTSVLVLPHRHPLLAAKMLATLDHLAPGRVILGVGVGWMQEEIELLGVPYARRGAWSDEALRVITSSYEYHGGFRLRTLAARG